MKTLERTLPVEHSFAVASLPWSNGTREWMMREVVRALKAILQDERLDIHEGVEVVPEIQFALNTTYHERYASTPYHVMFGRALTIFSTLASSTGEYWKVDALDQEVLRRKVANVVKSQQRLHKVVEERVKITNGKSKLLAEGSYRILQSETV